MTPKITKNIQVTTKKYLNSEVRKIALGILREVANALRKFKLDVQCHDIKCLYGLIITHGKVVDSVINVAERWKELNPSSFWYTIKDGDDEEDLERTIDMYYSQGASILHLRFYVDVLENPLRLKFYVEVATHEIKPSLGINLIKKYVYLPMPLEAIETTTETIPI